MEQKVIIVKKLVHQDLIKMIPELRIVDFEFMKEVRKEKTLTQIRDSIDYEYSLSVVQKILKKLEKVGFVKSERRGRKRFVKITENGEYFLKFYLNKRRLKK